MGLVNSIQWNDHVEWWELLIAVFFGLISALIEVNHVYLSRASATKLGEDATKKYDRRYKTWMSLLLICLFSLGFLVFGWLWIIPAFAYRMIAVNLIVNHYHNDRKLHYMGNYSIIDRIIKYFFPNENAKTFSKPIMLMYLVIFLIGTSTVFIR